MMRQKKPHSNNKSRTLMFSATILALTCTSAFATASQVRVVMTNGSEGVASVVDGRSASHEGQGSTGFVHLHGRAEHSRSRGLMVAGQRVNFTRSTSVFPSVDGMSTGLRARQLSGREVTVFGTSGGGGVQAVLVIVKPAAIDLAQDWSSPALSEATEDDSGPLVEVVSSSSPEE